MAPPTPPNLAAPMPQRPLPSFTSPPLPPAKLLLVDDREDNLLVLEELLRRPDIDMLKARSGREALELLLVHDVALALVDVQMPEMDGFEFAELVRGTERTRHVPLIFVTAGAQNDRRLFKGYETGAVDFLHKPLDPRILRNKVEVFIQLDRQRQQLARELSERSEHLRLNELFIAVLGHDLRSPLASLAMSAETLPLLSDRPEVLEVAGRMHSSCMRMRDMIEDVLDLARVRQAGGMPIQPRPLDLGSLVERVVEERRAAWPGARIRLNCDGDLSGVFDATRLSQATANLVDNALRHGERDSGVAVHVDGGHADHVVLSVANAGTIAPELLPHLFDPFRSGQQRERHQRQAGLGLGLYIVQQIVRAHRGAIAVHSPLGERQTRFDLTMPRQAAADGVTAACNGN